MKRIGSRRRGDVSCRAWEGVKWTIQEWWRLCWRDVGWEIERRGARVFGFQSSVVGRVSRSTADEGSLIPLLLVPRFFHGPLDAVLHVCLHVFQKQEYEGQVPELHSMFHRDGSIAIRTPFARRQL